MESCYDGLHRLTRARYDMPTLTHGKEAIESGQQVLAVKRAMGNPAIRYVHPSTGQSVVVDTVTPFLEGQEACRAVRARR